MNRKVRLSEEMILNLIKEVKNKGCIWNPTDDNYNDRFRIMTAWKEISKSLGLREDVVKAKWKNLRDLFRREAKRCKAQVVEDYLGKWCHFRTMWFLHRPEDYANDSHDGNEDNFDDDFDASAETFIKFEHHDSNEAEVYLDDPIDPTQDKRRRYNDDDYDMMFLKSLTPYFRQLEPLRKLVLRNKIQDMLMNEIAAQTNTNNLTFKKS